MRIYKIALFIAVFLGLLITSFVLLKKEADEPEMRYDVTVNDFSSCAEAGNIVLESYPRQCKTTDGRSFTEDIGNALEKESLIRASSPRPNDLITSPVKISGDARGTWFFEASFPIVLLDGNGDVVVQHFAQAKTDWMTENFVAFESEVVFTKPTTKNGLLILKKDNPSGLPEYDDELIIPIRFE
ncbi:MAG: hypothetical protein HUU49_02680 [Candidatus Buchananbacteria bacterium]|nr:hypothetical protein [Candidatus Buchananbacteria bacterium]